ncbi:DUF2167 domain-containing protein [Porticoccaceae bacterium LTM1]|nr:DUF2167 domain-containing protein [Porticoccaceae bacterium LTM1]
MYLTKFPPIFRCLIALLASLQIISATAEETEADETLTPEQLQYFEHISSLWQGMEKRTGVIELPGGIAKLDVPEEFYYLSPENTATVLEEFWGNPPGGETYGMIFPQAYTPFDGDSWGVTIQYVEEGYVSDDDADKIDYDDLLVDMKKDTREESAYRVEQGYEAIELVGWAAPPHYNHTDKTLHWAQELAFGTDPGNDHVLNYNVRVLGRKGYLMLNYIASIGQLEEINQNLEPVMAMTEFNDGFKYDQFDPDMDEVAAYGIGALVAGKVLAKTGILMTLLLVLKKFWIILIVAIGAFFKKLFSRKSA